MKARLCLIYLCLVFGKAVVAVVTYVPASGVVYYGSDTQKEEFHLDEEDHDDSDVDIKIIAPVGFRNALKDPNRLWENAKVPYEISSNYNERETKIINEAMEEFKNKTCVLFTPRTNEPTYILITRGSGCSATLGRFSKNRVQLASGCIQKGIVLHELLHVLSFSHEQNRPDRDGFVNILWDNIRDKKEKNFVKSAKDKVQDGGVGYDYDSVMHYGEEAFTKERGKKTIQVLTTGVKVGQRKGFSVKDVMKINIIYCNATSNTSESQEGPIKKRNKRSANNFMRGLRESLLKRVESFSQPLELPGLKKRLNVSRLFRRLFNVLPSTPRSYSMPVEISENETDSNGTSTLLKDSLLPVPWRTEDEDNNPFHRIEIRSSIMGRGLFSDPSFLWTDAVVPFVISHTEYENETKSVVYEAMEEFHNRTCIRFVERVNETTYITIRPGEGCVSDVGRRPNTTTNVTLSPSCLLKGIVMHELMHVLGFIHEQNRPDRDKYITVIWRNIVKGMESNFFEYDRDEVTTFDQPYDYDSIMHYGSHDFAVEPNLPTLVPTKRGQKIGQRNGFSKYDVERIKRAYCKNASVAGVERDFISKPPGENTQNVKDFDGNIDNSNQSKNSKKKFVPFHFTASEEKPEFLKFLNYFFNNMNVLFNKTLDVIMNFKPMEMLKFEVYE